jgi:galactokinase
LTLDRIDSLFAAVFGGIPDIITRAPGRVNLIGEHTDYNDGYVLPMAIGCEMQVAIRRRGDATVNLVAQDLGGALSQFSLNDPITVDPAEPWSNYPRGVVHALQSEGMSASGADVLLTGSVPQGLGLSSSASLEVAFGLAWAVLAGQANYDRTAIALAGQKAEHAFAGCKCGIMDQLVSARAGVGHALLIDCRNLEASPIAMPADFAVMIIHSGLVRGLVDGAYGERRAQCEAAARHYGVAALRDLDDSRLVSDKGALDAISFARARHVVTENARTLAAARALASGNLMDLGTLMAASHASMRDDFAITTPEIDRLVDIVSGAVGDGGGARMTGGGFGGAVVAVMPHRAIEAVRSAVLSGYATPQGSPPEIMIETAAAGASILRGG